MTRVILIGMKTAISVPDPVFRLVERARKQLGISRSQLFTKAVVEFLATRRGAEVTQSYDRVFGSDAGDPTDAQFRREAARRALAKVEW